MTSPTFEPAELAKLVRDAREALHLSKVKVSTAIGLSDTWLGKLEAGDRGKRPPQPRPEHIRALAHVLRLDEALALHLAGHSPDVPIEPPVGRPSYSEVAFTANVNLLPPAAKTHLFHLVAELADPENKAGAA